MTLIECPRCRGAQYDPEDQDEVTCPTCGGDPVRYVTREMSIDGYGDDRAEGMQDVCGRCRGAGGWLEPRACRECGGEGRVEGRMEPLTLQVTLDLDAMAQRMWAHEDDVPPATLEEVVIRGAILELARMVHNDVDHHDSLRHRVEQIREEEIREQLRPVIAEAIARAVQPTDSFGEPKGTPKTISELISERATAQLRHAGPNSNDYGRSKTLLDVVIHDEVTRVVGKELRDAMAAARAEVKAAVEAEGAKLLSETIQRLAAR